MPFCALALLWYNEIKTVSLLWWHVLGFYNQFFFLSLYSSQSSTKYVLTNRNGAATLGHWEEVWCTMKTLKRSKYLLKCFLLACWALVGGVAQVPRAVSDALNKWRSVWESPHERLVDSFFSIYPGSQPAIFLSVISLPVFSTSIYLVTSAPECTHRASKRRLH